MREARRFSPLVVLAGLALLLACSTVFAQSSPPLTKWVQPFPALPGGVLAPSGTYDDGVHGVADLYVIRMAQTQQSFHPDLPLTTVWSYNGYTPGPIIVANSGVPVYVQYINSLPKAWLFPEDTTLPLAPRTLRSAARGRAVPHLHGGHSLTQFDGGPMDWFTPGTNKYYWYTNDQPSTLLWFHDHAMGVTRTNAYAGLAGGYILRDAQEASLNLPAPPYEAALIIQDRIFFPDGSLRYPGTEALPMSFAPEFFGDTICVNGKVWPFMNVAPRKYRFRVLNGSQARFYNLRFGNKGPTLYQIGTEGGLLPTTAALREVLIAPGERADIIVDFSRYAGKSLILYNNANAPFPMGDAPDANTSQIVKFNVVPAVTSPDRSSLPLTPNPGIGSVPGPIVVDRVLTLDETIDKLGRLKQQINKTNFMAPTTELPLEGTSEQWRFLNLTVDSHPIHLHLINFKLVSRRPFDVPSYVATGVVAYTGPAVGPPANEAGWKETLRMNPGEETTIQMNFQATVDHRYTGPYVYHCHILEHEEHDMMRTFDVQPAP